MTTNQGQSQYEKKESTRNYEINELKEKTVVAPGSIRRLAVSVLVDANVNNAQRESILKAVSSAVGYNAARGDVISVESIPFSTELADRQKREEEELAQQQKQALYMKLAVAAVALLAVLYVVRTFLRKRQPDEPEVMEIPMQQPAHIMESAAAKELTPQEKERAAQREAIAKMAKAKPEEVAQLVKAWINEE